MMIMERVCEISRCMKSNWPCRLFYSILSSPTVTGNLYRCRSQSIPSRLRGTWSLRYFTLDLTIFENTFLIRLRLPQLRTMGLSFQRRPNLEDDSDSVECPSHEECSLQFRSNLRTSDIRRQTHWHVQPPRVHQTIIGHKSEYCTRQFHNINDYTLCTQPDTVARLSIFRSLNATAITVPQTIPSLFLSHSPLRVLHHTLCVPWCGHYVLICDRDPSTFDPSIPSCS